MVDMPEIEEGQDSGLAQDLEGHPSNPILLENFQNCIEKEMNSTDCDSSIMIKDAAQATSQSTLTDHNARDYTRWTTTGPTFHAASPRRSSQVSPQQGHATNRPRSHASSINISHAHNMRKLLPLGHLRHTNGLLSSQSPLHSGDPPIEYTTILRCSEVAQTLRLGFTSRQDNLIIHSLRLRVVRSVEIKEVASLLLMKHHSLMTPEVVLLAHSDFLMNNHNNFWSNFSLFV